MNRTAKIIGYFVLGTIALALIASAVTLYAMPFFADADTIFLSFGDTEISAAALHAQSFGTLLLAWLATAGAFVIGALSILFAFGVGALAIGFTILLMVGTAALLASPLILIGVILWLALRSSKNAPAPMQAPAQSSPNSAPPSAA